VHSGSGHTILLSLCNCCCCCCCRRRHARVLARAWPPCYSLAPVDERHLPPPRRIPHATAGSSPLSTSTTMGAGTHDGRATRGPPPPLPRAPFRLHTARENTATPHTSAPSSSRGVGHAMPRVAVSYPMAGSPCTTMSGPWWLVVVVVVVLVVVGGGTPPPPPPPFCSSSFGGAPDVHLRVKRKRLPPLPPSPPSPPPTTPVTDPAAVG